MVYKIIVQWRCKVYMKEQRGPFQTSITIHVQNLVVTSSDVGKVLRWDPEKGIADTTFGYAIECAQRKPVQVTVRIYSMDGRKVYEVTEEKMCPGSYSFRWEGRVNVVPSLDGLAPAGLYSFDVRAVYVMGYDQGQVRSSSLVITSVTVAGLPVDAQDYVKVRVGYTINDTIPPILCKIEVWGLIFDNAINQWYWAKLGEETASTNLGVNTKDLVLMRSAIASAGGFIYFIIHALDNHYDVYKDHQNRWALPIGSASYHKILDVPYYNQQTAVWCGEATAKMWIDYKSPNNPTQLDIAQWVLVTFGPQGAEDRNGNGMIDPEERAIWPLEYGSVLNHFIPANKYHRYVSASPDEIIGREAHLIAEYHEPSAAVVEMEFPGDPNGPPNNAWHWLLVVGCVADGWPGSGGVNIFGLWVHDPGGWFTTIPAYVSSDIWKQKYFEVYLDRDGVNGYMHVEDPPPGDKRINHLLPIRCKPPTKPYGTPVSLQQVQRIAEEGLGLYLLNIMGPLAPYLQQAQHGMPVFVRSLDPKFGDCYIVPYWKSGRVTAMVIVDAVTGQFHGAAACNVNWIRFPPISRKQAEGLAFRLSPKKVRTMELVWCFCEEAPSPYTPLWQVIYEDGETLFISQKGTIHRQLKRHSCVGERR